MHLKKWFYNWLDTGNILLFVPNNTQKKNIMALTNLLSRSRKDQYNKMSLQCSPIYAIKTLKYYNLLYADYN